MIYLKAEDTTIVVSSYRIKEYKDELEKPTVRPGMDIVMIGSIGVGGAVKLCKKYENDLSKKFSWTFIETVIGLEWNTTVEYYIEMVQNYMCNSYSMEKAVCYEVDTEGTFGGLYELSKYINKGIDIDISKIPVLQQVVEVAEFFDVNPYKMDGTGALIIVCNEGSDMVEYLTDEGLFASVIGTVTDNNDKIARNGDEVRYLEPTRVEELSNLL
ncbi:MAG: hypothetical protein J6W35_03135 [Eubacterium sp.]|nr:hypothetical protein [Eubacterium sp.]